MHFFRFILGAFLFLMLAYYIMLALNLCGVITFTKERIRFSKIIIPFYYWFN